MEAMHGSIQTQISVTHSPPQSPLPPTEVTLSPKQRCTQSTELPEIQLLSFLVGTQLIKIGVKRIFQEFSSQNKADGIMNDNSSFSYVELVSAVDAIVAENAKAQFDGYASVVDLVADIYDKYVDAVRNDDENSEFSMKFL
jgi:hypothetical protein